MRKLGVSIGGTTAEDIKRKLHYAKKAGFEVIFPGCETLEIGRLRCSLALEAGLELDNIHAPFDGINNMWLSGEAGDTMLARLMTAVDCCAEFGIKKTVVHISSGWDAPQLNDIGFARYDRLVAYAGEKGVKVAFENLRKPGNLGALLERYEKNPQVGFCWDCGHELCYTPGWEFMPLYGQRAICVHLHDNIGILAGDGHMLPFDGKRDWEKTARYLKESSYDGPIMLEIGYDTRYYDKLTEEQYYERAYAAAVKIRELMEK